MVIVSGLQAEFRLLASAVCLLNGSIFFGGGDQRVWLHCIPAHNCFWITHSQFVFGMYFCRLECSFLEISDKYNQSVISGSYCLFPFCLHTMYSLSGLCTPSARVNRLLPPVSVWRWRCSMVEKEGWAWRFFMILNKHVTITFLILISVFTFITTLTTKSHATFNWGRLCSLASSNSELIPKRILKCY